jgi:hypothetical protein
MALEMFETGKRARGDLAGVFEYAHGTGYLYLYEPNSRILAHLHIVSGSPGFAATDLSVKWNRRETMVGLYIRGRLWAVIDERGHAYGGNYAAGRSPNIPEKVASAFD